MTSRAFLLVLLCCASAFAQAQSVVGTVKSSVDAAPIGHARVTLYSNAGSQSLLTDATGSFTFGGVPAGAYSISVDRSGYLMPGAGGEQGQTTATANVTVEAEKKPEPVVVLLAPAPLLTGSVTDENGLPIPNSQVSLLRHVVDAGRGKEVFATQTSSNDIGDFRVSGLAPGRYLVCVSAPSSSYQGHHRLTRPVTCFPNVTEPASAQWLTVDPGAERILAFHIAPVRGIRATGTIATGGNPISLSLKRTDPVGFPQIQSQAIDWDEKTSSFQALALVPGDYLISAIAYNADHQNFRALRAFHAGAEDIHDLRLTLRDGPYLSGAVQIPALPASPNTPVTSGFNGDSLSIYANTSGAFRIPVPEPGEYSVNVSGPAGWSIQSMTQGGIDIRDRKIIIGTDVSPDPIEISLSQSGGTVEISFPAGSQSDTQQPVKLTLLRHAATGDQFVEQGPTQVTVPNATVTFPNVPAGDYLLFAWPVSANVEYLNPEVLQKFRSFGQAVAVRDGETARVAISPLRLE